jgi:hypothetical protein
MEHKTINDIPIYHWEIETDLCDDQQETAKWVWKKIKKIAYNFCQLFCIQSDCQIRLKSVKYPKYIESDSYEYWHICQKELHESFNYLSLPEVIDYCPACAIVKAFSYFPLLKDPYIPPMNTISRHTEYDEEIHPEFINATIFPCYKLEVISCDSEFNYYETVNREMALLYMNIDVLPIMHPVKMQTAKNNLYKGKKILRMVNSITDPPQKNNESITSQISSEGNTSKHLSNVQTIPIVSKDNILHHDDSDNIPKGPIIANPELEVRDVLSSVIERYDLTPNQACALKYFYKQKLEGKTMIIDRKLKTKLSEECDIESDRLRDIFNSRPKAYRELFIKERPGQHSLNDLDEI